MKTAKLCGLKLIFLILFLTLAVSAKSFVPRETNTAQMLASTEWLAKNLKTGNLTLLHIAAGKSAYDKTHIEGARFVAWNELTVTRGGFPNELPTVENLQKLFFRLGVGNTGTIVIYGELSGLMAARAFFTLDYLGHGSRVRLLDGGLEKWQAEKRPVSTTAAVFAPTEFTPRVNVNTVTFLQTVRDVSWLVSQNKSGAKSSEVMLLDARPPEEFSGQKPGDKIERPGHIPGAINLFWMENLVSRENPVMKPVKELRRIYQSKGFTPGKRIISYCRTGGQASHTYFTLKYLGFDVVMYDGSFIEWSSNPDTPVEK